VELTHCKQSDPDILFLEMGCLSGLSININGPGASSATHIRQLGAWRKDGDATFLPSRNRSL
jgi:hypothetical protein